MALITTNCNAMRSLSTKMALIISDFVPFKSSKTALIQAILALLYVLKIALSGFLIKVKADPRCS